MTHEPLKRHLKFLVCVCSTSRYASHGRCTTPPEEDISGSTATALIRDAGHDATYVLVSDDEHMIADVLEQFLSGDRDVLVFVGGTGLAPRDITIEVAERYYNKHIVGFGELFRQLSFEQVGTAAMLSRASAGVCSRKVVFCVPGSPSATELALSALILCEAGHILKHAEHS
ncbi:MAG: MogA/MoaB family molybdenum cofactor biosynthesis protein [Methermicoccaceae archaeon]